MAEAKTYCIMCGEERKGLAVREDWVLRILRGVKKAVTKKTSNDLVVCRGCYPNYEKRRNRFSWRKKMNIALGLLFAAFSLIIAPELVVLLMDIAVIILLYAFALLSYTPDVDTSGSTRDKSRKNER